MPTVELSTEIRAPVERCFDLARSIDFHVVTAASTQERAVAGRVAGLIELGETVTWRARHFGVWQELTVEITVLDRPTHFQDVMTRGAFARMRHDHRFEQRDGETTVMRDDFHFQAPFGVVGDLVSAAILARYLRRFLVERAALLKATAESDAWRRYLQVSDRT